MDTVGEIEILIKSVIQALDANNNNEEQEKCVFNAIDAICRIRFQEISEHHFRELLQSLLQYGSVPFVKEGDERDLCEKDFMGISSHALISLKCYELLLNKEDNMFLKKMMVIPCMILCAQHGESQLWTTVDLTKKCQDVLSLLLGKLCATDVFQLLQLNDNLQSNMVKLFSYFISYLTRKNWKCNPGMKVAFSWCLFNVKHPYVEFVLKEVMPPALLFVDDFVVANRLLGMECLSHILENTPRAELQRYGRAEVIHNALKNLVYTRDPQIISAVYPVLLKVLSVIETDPKKDVLIRKVNRYDVLFQILLQEMDMEQGLTLRSVYSELLDPFINVLGITVLKQMKTTMRIILQYLEVYDDPTEKTRRNCLRALRSLICAARPRMPNHMLQIIKSLLRLLYDVHDNTFISSDIKVIVTAKCVKCLKLLREVSKQDFDDICIPLMDLIDEIEALRPIREVIATT